MAPVVYSVKSCALGQQRPFSPRVPAETGCLFAVSCVHLREEPVSSYFSMVCCSFVSHWCKWSMLPCSQCALILVLTYVEFRPGCNYGVSVHCMCVQISSLYAIRRPVLPKYMQLTLVSWYVASMLCCHCWDVQFEWCFADAKLSL